MEKGQERFLIIHLFSNGDCLYTTSLARQLKWDQPGCHITWAVAPFCAPILQNNPFIDQVWQIPYIADRKFNTFKVNKERLFKEAEEKHFDQVFFTQIIGDNYVYYDGQVRSSIFSTFNRKISVPIDPILELNENEKSKVISFVEQLNIRENDFVILFECAPLSAQVAMDINRALKLSQQLTEKISDIRIILSSQSSIDTNRHSIIDGSVLSLRETAFLTHYCHLLVGCSSGITWVSTSDSAKPINSIQLLNKHAYIFNSPTLDHIRQGLPTGRWLEMFEFDDEMILSCIEMIHTKNFPEAKQQFGQKTKQTFRIYRGIVHRFLSEGKFKLLGKFLSRNFRLYGWNLSMTKSLFLGFILFPVQAILNYINRKKIDY